MRDQLVEHCRDRFRELRAQARRRRLAPPYVGVTKSTTGATETTGTLSSPSLMRMTLRNMRHALSCSAAAIASLATSREIRSV